VVVSPLTTHEIYGREVGHIRCIHTIYNSGRLYFCVYTPYISGPGQPLVISLSCPAQIESKGGEA